MGYKTITALIKRVHNLEFQAETDRFWRVFLRDGNDFHYLGRIARMRESNAKLYARAAVKFKVEYPAKQQRVHPDKVRISFFVESPELKKEDDFNVFKTQADAEAFVQVRKLKHYQVIRMEIEPEANPNYVIVIDKKLI